MLDLHMLHSIKKRIYLSASKTFMCYLGDEYKVFFSMIVFTIMKAC